MGTIATDQMFRRPRLLLVTAMASLIVNVALTGSLWAAGSIFDMDDGAPPAPAPARPAVSPPPRPAVTPPATAPTTPPQPVPAQPAPAVEAPVPERPAAARRPVPDAAELAGPQKMFKELFEKELADRLPAGRRALAERLLADAEKSGSRPTERFVLLTGARHAAEEAAALPLAFRASDAMAEDFNIDPLALKVRAASKTPVKADTPARTAENCRAGLELMDQLLAAGDEANAARLAALLKPSAAADPASAAALLKRTKRLDAQRLARQRIAKDFEKLKVSANDPAANAAVGQFFCFYCDDWAQGLTHLARGSDEKTSALARAEQSLAGANPPTSGQIGRVADGWWDLAKSQPEAPRAIVQLHAAGLYRRAVEGQEGMARQMMEKRIAEADAAGEPAGGRVVDLLAMIDPDTHALAGHWARKGTTVTVEKAEFARVQIPYKPPEEYDFRTDFVYHKNGGPVIQICPLGDSGGVVAWYLEFNKTKFDSSKGAVVNGKPPFIKDGQAYTALVKVRRDRVQGYLNGALICEFTRTRDKLDIPSGWRLRDPQCVGLAVWASDAVFSRAEITNITGRGERVQPAGGAK